MSPVDPTNTASPTTGGSDIDGSAPVTSDTGGPDGNVADEPAAVGDEPTGSSAPAGDSVPGEVPTLSVEDLVESLESVSAERDQYLDALRRLQAEFENYRKAVAKRESEAKERANEGLASELLPVLDACDGAVANGSEDVALIQGSLVGVLVKQGLTRIDEAGAEFDPEIHEAVIHEDGDDAVPTVAEILRVGYQWKGRTLRAAMVKVRS